MKTLFHVLAVAALVTLVLVLAQGCEKGGKPATEQQTAETPAAEEPAAETPAAEEPVTEEPPAETPAPDGTTNPVAVIETSMGTIEVELFAKAAPKTVANFLDLAEGKKEFTDPKTGERVTRNFYDGLIFHRVIKGFMIQGGCPLGNGGGGPGYRFEDEINAKGLGLDKMKAVESQGENKAPNPWLLIRTQQDFQRRVLIPLCQKMGIANQEDFEKRKDEVQQRMDELTLMEVYENEGYVYDDQLEAVRPKKGNLAMANSGPNTNGSQFFINLEDTPHLTGRHTVFGKVISGMDVVEAIGEVPVGPGARPVKDVKILTIRQKK